MEPHRIPQDPLIIYKNNRFLKIQRLSELIYSVLKEYEEAIRSLEWKQIILFAILVSP